MALNGVLWLLMPASAGKEHPGCRVKMYPLKQGPPSGSPRRSELPWGKLAVETPSKCPEFV